jgi:hypothetical protein
VVALRFRVGGGCRVAVHGGTLLSEVVAWECIACLARRVKAAGKGTVPMDCCGIIKAALRMEVAPRGTIV